MKKLLLIALITLLALAVASAQDWPMVNYDSSMSRHSPQMTIGKDNVNQLQIKWILNTGHRIEDPPLIVGKTGYVQNNAMQVIAIDLDTGLSKWVYDPNILLANNLLPRSTTSHGLAYENGVIYAPTGPNGTILAIDANKGTKIWESPVVQPNSSAFRISAMPLIWKNYVIAGSALGDEPPFGFPQKGTVTALDKSTGKIVWQTNLTTGAWITGVNATKNGGGTAWSGGAIDMDKGIVYLPVGNPAPDFDASTRPGLNLYCDHVVAVDLSNGKILWATPFVAQGTVLSNIANLSLPDTHDWDTTWGTNLVNVKVNGSMQNVVIGHDKRGDIIAMNASTGKPIWWKNVAVTVNDNTVPTPTGSPVTWPGSDHGVEDWTAFDNSTLYAAVENNGYIFYSIPAGGTVAPAFDASPTGIGNGSIVALDLATGKVKWEHKTEFPTWVSPLITNGVVFSGQVTATGKPYPYGAFGTPTKTPLISTGIILALDAETGNTLWAFNLGAPCGIGGPSIGDDLLLVPTGIGQVPNDGGYLIAFGLPSGNSTGLSVSQLASLPPTNQTIAG
jgi:alcohol dehydrogenase (cytochrome c)